MRIRSRIGLPAALVLAGCTPDGSVDVEVPEAGWPPLCINELMASNRATIRDGVGEWADWIELHNPTDADVDLDGWSLSDRLGEPDAAVLSWVRVPAGGEVVLWADGSPEEGPNHLGFRLEEGGEAVALFAPDGTAVDGLSFGPQVADVSVGRAADCGHSWVLFGEPTPGRSNGDGDLGEAPAGWPGPGPACHLADDLEDPFYLEGDEVAVSVWCTGPLASDDARILPVRLPEGAAFLPDARVLRWNTGPASGGRAEAVLSVSPEADPTAVPSAAAIVFWVADDPTDPDNVPVDPATYTEEWGLPVVYVYPDGPLSQAEGPATTWFEGHPYRGTARIRGASSASYTKPSYTLQFDGAPLPVTPWGVTRDHLVLLTTFDDNSYVRQKLIFDQWAAIAAYWGEARLTPRTFFAVVYLDGVYHGLYVGLDRIDDEFTEQMGFVRDANLYKSVNHDANFYLTNASGQPKADLHDGFEKKEGEPGDDFSDLDALVSFTGNADAPALVSGAPAWIDVQEFMDWFLLVHYSVSADSAGKNCYLYHDPASGRFRYAPWDFNHSWGQGWYTYRVSSASQPDYTWNNKVFWALQEEEDTNAEMWERFAAMRADGPFDPVWIRGTVDGYYRLVQPSAERDWERWADAYYAYGGWTASRTASDDWTDFEGEKAYLYEWLDDRAALFYEVHP